MRVFLAWGTGIGSTLLLGTLFSLAEPSLAMWLVSGLLLIGWTFWGWFYPQGALACLLLVWLTLDQRASIPLFALEGGWNRGGLSLADLLWPTFALVWLVRWAIARNGACLVVNRCQDPLLLLLVPYLGLTIFLPILGVLIGGWPLSYAMPGGLRPLQWISLTLFGYWLVRRYGIQYAWQLLLVVFTLASVLHAAYALLQVLALQGTVPWEWLVPDQIFAQRFPINWFDDLRATGLLVNPNSYGLFGTLVLLLLSASLLSRALPKAGIGLLMGITGVLAVASSASRSAAVGLIAGLVVMGVMAASQAFLKKDGGGVLRVMGFGIGLVLIVGLTATFLWLTLPSHLLSRIARLQDIMSMGPEADSSALGRVVVWERGLQAFEERFPFGTWVLADYALDVALDNHYLSLLVQGTPLYLGLFLMLLGGILGRVWLAGLANEHAAGAAALVLAGIVALIGIGSFTLAPLRETEVLVPFWFLLGINWRGAAESREKIRSFSWQCGEVNP